MRIETKVFWAGFIRSPGHTVEVALKHPIKLIANALGSPPKDVIDQAHEAGVPVAALAGTAAHAQRHVDNGVDIVVAQGHEAGGHTGEIASMVLVPEVVDALGGRAPVLAAGGIGTGRQVAAALALGASGVWMGSAFLTAAEYHLGVRDESGVSTIQRALLSATSSDTVRRRIYTGKPARLLKSRWTEAWDAPRCARTAADAAAEHPGFRGASADERVDRPDRGGDAGRADRGGRECATRCGRSPTSSRDLPRSRRQSSPRHIADVDEISVRAEYSRSITAPRGAVLYR